MRRLKIFMDNDKLTDAEAAHRYRLLQAQEMLDLFERFEEFLKSKGIKDYDELSAEDREKLNDEFNRKEEGK
jgi:hypothetical protein